MKLIIFCCSPRPETKSNTALIANAFANGVKNRYDDVEIFYIYKRNEWENYKQVFAENNEIIFATPLFVECVPSLLLEFLETLRPKAKETKIGFILQGGFEECCQLRTCEKFLEKLPSYLNCSCSGTLIKGGMFTLALCSPKSREKKMIRFAEFGKVYAQKGCFEKSAVTQFARPERYSIAMKTLIILLKPLNKIAWWGLSKKLSIKGRLNARPYRCHA
jgi:hypothetical protein